MTGLPAEPTGPAYYNENDPDAADALRSLIEAGVIAPGDVDERSIEDVTPAELFRYAQRHFFAGYGVWSYALRSVGWPDNKPVVTGSCPCQPFSQAGEGGALEDERHLWPALYWHIILGEPCPVFGEQVASDAGLAWLDIVLSTLEVATYSAGALDLCSAGVGSPNIRQRLYWMAHPESGREWAGLRDNREAGQWRVEFADSGRALGMDNAELVGRHEGRRDNGGDERIEPCSTGANLRMGEPGVEGLQRLARDGGGTRGWNVTPRSTPTSSLPHELGDAPRGGREGEDLESVYGDAAVGEREADEHRRRSSPCIMADAASFGRRQVDTFDGGGGEGDREKEWAAGHADGGTVGPLVHALGERLQRGEKRRLDPRREEVQKREERPDPAVESRDGGDQSRELADANVSGRKQESRVVERGGDAGAESPGRRGELGSIGEGVGAGRPGATNGFWRNADWLFCRDGRLRPVEPGSSPLAYGLPRSFRLMPETLRRLASVAKLDQKSLARAKGFRIASLRGYGNAINAELAITFLEAATQILKEAGAY